MEVEHSPDVKGWVKQWNLQRDIAGAGEGSPEEDHEVAGDAKGMGKGEGKGKGEPAPAEPEAVPDLDLTRYTEVESFTQQLAESDRCSLRFLMQFECTWFPTPSIAAFECVEQK